MEFILFIFGLAVGSFLNVLAFRYDSDRFLFSREALGLVPRRASRRSRCIHCGKALRWYELIPVVSYVVQRGRCRACRARLSVQYPLVELLAGLLFLFVPIRLHFLFPFLTPLPLVELSALWIIVFLLLLLMAAIDFRLRIIPDEIHIVLLCVAALALLIIFPSGATGESFLGSYGLLFWLSPVVWVNKLAGLFIGGALTGFIFIVSRGRGMGMGDVKLAAALGLLFSWPDIVVLLGVAFVFGALAGVAGMAWGRKTLKSSLAFGPFLALASTFVFFGGFEFIRWYLGVFLG